MAGWVLWVLWVLWVGRSTTRPDSVPDLSPYRDISTFNTVHVVTTEDKIRCLADTLAGVTMQTPQLGFDPRPLLILIVLFGSASLVAVLVVTDENPCWQTSDDDTPDNSSAKRVARLSLPLSTAEIGGKIVVTDSAGERVKLSCVNWY